MDTNNETSPSENEVFGLSVSVANGLLACEAGGLKAGVACGLIQKYMCGRYGIHSKKKEIETTMGIEMDNGYEERYNAAPSQLLPIITDDAPQHGQLFRWGLIPSWAKDQKIANYTINARSETLTEKPSFRNAIRQQRCLVLANGYYEWKKMPQGKMPFWITIEKESLFAMAGLWEQWKNPNDGQWIYSFSIITVPANKRLAPLHERMPAILPPNHYHHYLDRQLPLNDVLDLLQTFPDGATNAYPVSNSVNSVANESADLITPVGGWLY